MPPLTRWFIKVSLIYLVAALLLGAALEARTLLGLPASVNTLRPVYFHLFMVGWVTQLIFGVAGWMFPKASPQRPHGSHHETRKLWGRLSSLPWDRLARRPPMGKSLPHTVYFHTSEVASWATFGLLNAGLVLRVISEPLGALRPGSIWGWLMALSALLQWLAGLAFVLNIWARVRVR
ncbi:MAG: hypothetical protein Kow0063_04200 [Anaerolineae bacterium]